MPFEAFNFVRLPQHRLKQRLHQFDTKNRSSDGASSYSRRLLPLHFELMRARELLGIRAFYVRAIKRPDRVCSVNIVSHPRVA